MYKYKNAFNNSKLLKMTFIKKNIIINWKLVLQIYINIYMFFKLFLWKGSKREIGEWEGSKEWKENRG